MTARISLTPGKTRGHRPRLQKRRRRGGPSGTHSSVMADWCPLRGPERSFTSVLRIYDSERAELFALPRDQTPPAVRDESGENTSDCRHKRQGCLGRISKHHDCRTDHNDEQTQRGKRRQALANLEQAWKHQTQRAEYLGDGYGLQEHSRHMSLLFKGLRWHEQLSSPREQEN